MTDSIPLVVCDWQDKVKTGIRPFLDPRYRNQSFAERTLVRLMEQCWVHDPNKRPDVFKLVVELREAIAENERLERFRS
jgi:hypothetical protein